MKFQIETNDSLIKIKADHLCQNLEPILFREYRGYSVSDEEWSDKVAAAKALVFQSTKFHELHEVLKSALLHDKKGCEAFRLEKEIGTLP